MEYQNKPVERLFQDVKGYIITQRDLAMTVVSKKGSDVLFIVVLVSILLVLGSFFLLFLSISMAYLIGQLIHSVWLGFLIVAVLYLLLAVLIWLNKDALLKTPIFKLFFKLLAPKLKDEDYE